FTQSYTYFTWRNSKKEFVEYVEELTKTDQKEYMRPNFWPNTPDINPYHLQGANEPKFIQRYVLAATLSSNIGIYGPVYEQMISEAITGKEEYLNSEKFQICDYDWFKENKLTRIISKVNQIRHEHEALQQTNNIHFCKVENNNLIAFYKWNQERTDELLIIINLDQYYPQQGTVQLPLAQLGISQGHHLIVKDLVTQSSYNWHGEWNFVELHPTLPFHIFKIIK
ncbi:MAG: alpha-1,4-glucan--maltose-1-phosphate maltosyltransferase, partial [Winogradskyella sp.]|nr:alpha-1,4-glucan--maltose-1-phosphate maltosyltransferase [Winogradskyella sp.]